MELFPGVYNYSLREYALMVSTDIKKRIEGHSGRPRRPDLVAVLAGRK